MCRHGKVQWLEVGGDQVTVSQGSPQSQTLRVFNARELLEAGDGCNHERHDQTGFRVDTNHGQTLITVQANDFPGSTPGGLGRLEIRGELNEFGYSDRFVDPCLRRCVEVQGGPPGTVDVGSETQDFNTRFCSDYRAVW